MSPFPGALLAAIWRMGFAEMKEMAKSAKPTPEPESVAADRRKPGTLQRWRGDFFGGTVAALIAMPYGMALAMAMGLRPEAGLYTSIIGGAISGMISDAPLATPGLSATVVPVLAVLVRTHGVGAAQRRAIARPAILRVRQPGRSARARRPPARRSRLARDGP